MSKLLQKKENLTNTPRNWDHDPISEESERLKAERQALAQSGVKEEPEKQLPFKDSTDFQEYVAKNLWANRRENGFSWRCDVFAFIREVYAPFLGLGLVQSDIKACDPKLYAQLHQQLTAMEPDQKSSVLDDLKLPSEADARLAAITDESEKAAFLGYREWERKRSEERRMTHKLK